MIEFKDIHRSDAIWCERDLCEVMVNEPNTVFQLGFIVRIDGMVYRECDDAYIKALEWKALSTPIRVYK